MFERYLFGGGGGWRHNGGWWTLPGKGGVSVLVPWEFWRSKGREKRAVIGGPGAYKLAYVNAVEDVIGKIARAEGRDPSEVIRDIQEVSGE
jgi:hypothetical protein